MIRKAIFYSYKSHKTKRIAERIGDLSGADTLTPVDAEQVKEEDFLKFDLLVLGVPTWFDGELPSYWDEFVPALKDMDLSGKKFAIFGLADQVGYPENFGDAVGIMAGLMSGCHAENVGETSDDGYHYESSGALKNGKFLGLILDQENQARLTEERLTGWVEQLKKHF
jgi:flavodoxin I